jgi:N-acetylmuramoyl-L-alanine amidase
MKIVNHLLYNDDDTPIRFEIIPNYTKTSKVLAHEYLVLHFTSGMNVGSVVTWFKNPAARVSAHLCIGRDGSIVQFVPFDTVAWHAGDSVWADRTGLNKYSIGIELDNAGTLKRYGDKWMLGKNIIPDDLVIIKTHKLEYGARGWHIYTEAQINTCREVMKLLFAQYKLLDVVGHEDISLGGKVDPGPAFPMDEFRAAAWGLTPDTVVTYTTTRPLYLRSGPSDRYTVVGTSLKIGTRVVVIERLRGWANVALEVLPGIVAFKGWLPERRLKCEPPPPRPDPTEPDDPDDPGDLPPEDPIGTTPPGTAGSPVTPVHPI